MHKFTSPQLYADALILPSKSSSLSRMLSRTWLSRLTWMHWTTGDTVFCRTHSGNAEHWVHDVISTKQYCNWFSYSGEKFQDTSEKQGKYFLSWFGQYLDNLKGSLLLFKYLCLQITALSTLLLTSILLLEVQLSLKTCC